MKQLFIVFQPQLSSPPDAGTSGYASRPPKRTPRRRDSQQSSIQSPPSPQVISPPVMSPPSVMSPPPPMTNSVSAQTTTLADTFKSAARITPTHQRQTLPSKVKKDLVTEWPNVDQSCYLLIAPKELITHLNRKTIQFNLSVPGIQGHQENALIKSFKMSPHLICLFASITISLGPATLRT